MSMTWLCRDKALTLREPPCCVRVMGILNMTPDSFSDGGQWCAADAAQSRMLGLARSGADIVDIGGQSTRPGYTELSAQEEWPRIAPLLERLSLLSREGAALPVVSVDTFLPEVALKAMECGAQIINDVRGFADPAMREVAAKYGAGCVVMAGEDITSAADPVEEVRAFFERRVEECVRDGIEERHICLDCGIGFGKTREQESVLLRRMGECRVRGLPLLAAASRKRIIVWLTGEDVPPQERDAATHRAHMTAILAGADMVRVHDAAGAYRSIMLNMEQIMARQGMPQEEYFL